MPEQEEQKTRNPYLVILEDALRRMDDEELAEGPVQKMDVLRLWVERIQVVINETREKVAAG